MSPTPLANDFTHEIGHKQETQPTQSQQVFSVLVSASNQREYIIFGFK